MSVVADLQKDLADSAMPPEAVSNPQSETALAMAPAVELVARRTDGRIKLYTILRLLNFRREHPDLCTTGQYIPLEASGRP